MKYFRKGAWSGTSLIKWMNILMFTSANIKKQLIRFIIKTHMHMFNNRKSKCRFQSVNFIVSCFYHSDIQYIQFSHQGFCFGQLTRLSCG